MKPEDVHFPEVHNHFNYYEGGQAVPAAKVEELITKVTDLHNLTVSALTSVINALNAIPERLNHMEETIMADLTRITDEVSQTKDLMGSAAALIRNIAQLLRDANVDQTPQINDLADSLDQAQGDLAAAISENTPAATEPPA